MILQAALRSGLADVESTFAAEKELQAGIYRISKQGSQTGDLTMKKK